MTKLHKILLPLLITTTAQANHNFYLHGAVGAISQHKPSLPEISDDSVYRIKKTTPAPEISFGVGYQFSPRTRGEIVFVKPFFNKSRMVLKDERTNEFTDYAIITPNVNSLQLRGYVDIFDICDTYKVYLGAGVGASHVKGKLKIDYGNEANVYKFKHKYNFAYIFAAGTSFNISKDLKIGLEYNYSYHGKARDGFYKTPLRSHGIIAKIRWDL
ncbi:hypothetical protein phytr_11880 [Candidatus Phycorickettsia trachydisci]|uniref:Outer membrane protein beta-barrel domain-containing protein n=1 Tax=Candidatus Phycorickettsia trachydisci TaxID=2115978 RepID=A0A2P1PA19_9RICK|nr:outer membrane beta-barrel protein [Candidatus Phycorickettsia trachydisci]AVP88113.1 hypothetical protein phytr_11880 [Candidatus Phycorickettsia trachydisci]